jgi:hypothetical protein
MILSPPLLHEGAAVHIYNWNEVEFGVFEHVGVLIVSVDKALVDEFQALVERHLS